MNKYLLFLFIITTILLVAKPPKSKTAITTWVENKTIYGRWRWEYTECCGKNKGITKPISNDENIFLDLVADNTFIEIGKKYRTPRKGTIHLSNTNYNNKTIKTIQFNDERPAHYSLSASGDTLMISWEYLELQREIFIRIK